MIMTTGRKSIPNIITKWALAHGRRIGWEGTERIDKLAELFSLIVEAGYDEAHVKMGTTKRLVMERITAPSKKGSKATANWKKMAERDYNDAYVLVFDPSEGDEITTEFSTPDDQMDMTDILAAEAAVAPKPKPKQVEPETSDIEETSNELPELPDLSWRDRYQEPGVKTTPIEDEDEFLKKMGLK